MTERNTFPRGEGIARPSSFKHQFTGLLGETDVYILLYRISPLLSLIHI